MHSVETCDVVIFMCDASEGLVDQDLKIINMVSEMGKPLVLAFNKMDLLTKRQKDDLDETKRVQSNFVDNFFKIENSFRSSLKLQSIQLKLIFRKSDNPFENKVNKLTDRQIKKRQRMMKHVKK